MKTGALQIKCRVPFSPCRQERRSDVGLVGFHVHFRPDARDAAGPRGAGCIRCAFFPSCGSGDSLLDLALLSVSASLSLPGFSFLFLLSMHLFVSDSYSLIWKHSAPPNHHLPLSFLPLSFKVPSVIMRLTHRAHNSLSLVRWDKYRIKL